MKPGQLHEGDRVLTPQGLGTVTKIVNASRLERRDRAQISVRLDEGQNWIPIFSYDELQAPEEEVEWPA